MRILHGLQGLTSIEPGGVVSIGNFDGVHRGHQRILQRARELCADRRCPLTVVTFEPHPLTVLRPALAPPRISSMEMKSRFLESAGAESLVVLPPEPSVLELSAEAFWVMLRDRVKPAYLVEGLSFNFGKNRGGTIEKLRDWASLSEVRLEVVAPVSVALTDLTVAPVSSSLVRWLIAHGRVRDAAVCLARAHVLEGDVIKGHQRGRSIGVPTANMRCEQIVPMDGVYAGRCIIDDQVFPVALSVGTMPTFGDNQRQVEAHLVGFSGDLYGRRLTVEVLDWVREQRKYNGIEALKAQMAKDLDWVTRRVTLAPEQPVVELVE